MIIHTKVKHSKKYVQGRGFIIDKHGKGFIVAKDPESSKSTANAKKAASEIKNGEGFHVI